MITDQMMPGLAGTGLAAGIHAIRPDLPIILTTGYSASLTPDRVKAMGIRKLLLKPISVDELASAVRNVFYSTKPK